MRKSHVSRIVVVLAAMTFCHQECDAQSAFFPIERMFSLYKTQDISLNMSSYARDATGAFGTPVSSLLSDENAVADADGSDVVDGNASALSDGSAAAETIPFVNANAAVAESSASIGGIWSVTTLASSPNGEARATNSEWAHAKGDFEVLANPTYPSVTAGTLQITMTIDVPTASWDNISVFVSCGDSYLAGWNGIDGTFNLFGYLEGYGPIEEEGVEDISGVYTAYRSSGYGDTFSTEAYVGGNVESNPELAVGPNDGDGRAGNLSAVVSAFVSNP